MSSEMDLLEQKLLSREAELRGAESRITFLKECVAELKNIIQKVKK